MTAVDTTELRDRALSSGFVQRELIRDGIVDIKALSADPSWEMDIQTGGWFRRSPEFCAARAETEAALPDQRAAAEIALGVAMRELAADLPPQDDGPVETVAPTRQLYDMVASWDNGCKPVHITSGEAIQEWRRRLLTYVSTSHGDILWWRYRPEIDAPIPFGETKARWAVYSRLAIGDPVSTDAARSE